MSPHAVLPLGLSNVFVMAFAWLYLGETLRWNELSAFALIMAAVLVATLPG